MKRGAVAGFIAGTSFGYGLGYLWLNIASDGHYGYGSIGLLFLLAGIGFCFVIRAAIREHAEAPRA